MRTARAWTPAVAIAIVIFALSAQQDLAVTTGWLDLVLRKLAHLGVFAALAVACARGLAAHGLAGRRRDGAAWALAVAYAVSDELHQTTVPGRVGAPRDVLIDAAGAALGLAALHLAPRLGRRLLDLEPATGRPLR